MKMAGHSKAPPLRQRIVPSSEITWLMPLGRKSANWMKPTGRPPAIARPMAVPVMVDSVRAELMTRSVPWVVDSPRVTPKTSPLGSAMSSPTSTTRSSAARRASSTRRIASIISTSPGSASGCVVPGASAAGKGLLTAATPAGSAPRRAASAASSTAASASASIASRSESSISSARRRRRFRTGSWSRSLVSRPAASRYVRWSSALVWFVSRSQRSTNNVGPSAVRASAIVSPRRSSSGPMSRASKRWISRPRNSEAGTEPAPGAGRSKKVFPPVGVLIA